MADTKQSTDPVVPAEVTELIDESQTIQGWIDKLAELKNETTPAVFEKVHTDYRVRLSAVTSRLSEHRTDLTQSLEERRTGAEALRAERDERAAELEEARLRFAVGEYASEEWEEQRASIEGQLQSLKERLATEDAGLEKLESILASIPDGDAPAGEPSTPGADWRARLAEDEVETEDAEMSPDESPVAEAETEEVDAGPELAEPEPEVEEAPVAESATADGPAEEKTAVADSIAESPEDSGGADGEDGEYLDELEFLESLSLAESDRFDAVSAMLEEEEGGKGGSE